jgi:hypothetical protein
MKHESDYYRARARFECEAAFNATSAAARRTHATMARAYQILVELQELERLGSLPPGKVASISKVLRDRERTEYGGNGSK